MTAVVIFVLGVLIIAGFVLGLGRERRSTKPYTGDLINRLIEATDRVLRRRLP